MKDQIMKTVSDLLGIPASDIDEDSDFFEELGADSLDGVDILISLENMFDISIPEQDAIDLRSVNKILSYLEENL